MFLVSCLVSLFLQAMIACQAARVVPVPEVDEVARVKEHRRGASGDLVEGEEDMRKLLLQWESVPDAIGYEVCHNCDHDDGGEGEIIPVGVGRKFEKGARPVLVRANVPFGRNSFKVRVSLKEGEWGPWSEPRIFYVDRDALGQVDHQHEEL